MTRIQDNQPVQAQNTAAESKPERSEAGENAVREFSRAMKKDAPSGQEPGVQEPGAQEQGAGEQAASQPSKTGQNRAETALSGTLAHAASADGPSGGVPGREGREAGSRPAGEGNAAPHAGKTGGTAAEAGRVAGGARDESMLHSSAFSLNRGGARKDAASGPGQAAQSGEKAAPREENAVPRGDSILAGLGQQALAGLAPGGGAGSVSGPSAVDAPRIDADMTSKLVDRILVSAPDATGNAEVRISLREDVLPGTEIRIQRQPDGGVSVRFVTGDARAEQMLGSRQLGDLQTILAQNLQVEVRVAVLRTDGSMSAEAGTGGQQGDGQGRGGQGGGDGQPRDGRSRQHDIFDALRDERA